MLGPQQVAREEVVPFHWFADALYRMIMAREVMLCDVSSRRNEVVLSAFPKK
jgi:hypothetical protein